MVNCPEPLIILSRVATREQRHHEERPQRPFLLKLAQIQNRHDIGMVQASEDFALPLKQLNRRGVRGVADHLHRDITL